MRDIRNKVLICLNQFFDTSLKEREEIIQFKKEKIEVRKHTSKVLKRVF